MFDAKRLEIFQVFLYIYMISLLAAASVFEYLQGKTLCRV